ncbi:MULTISPECIES: APC family permease [unclassified Shinella]|jgi:putrescine importer|uniref:APC family permease n=1 Tax=unclassified Shinella TaxID=2643062 RepID=UPI00234EBCDF|nr:MULTISPECIES: amino acid permease [unclassified Shinella]MCO5152064.1 amino acid permease [Shinella sp.]MDC7266617.1 amino acid permease [Shinella sp. HY16]MDC7273514.1 amino acid permease [Shinella sp. YZ44]
MTQTIKLDRTLGLWSVVLFGLAYMTPMIVFGTFGALASASQGTTAMAYFIAALAIFLTAASYGVMARVYPVAGSAYTYARRSLNSGVGFLVGWAVLLDYFFLPMVIWLIGAAYLTAAFPAVPAWMWIVGFIVLTTAINVIGIAFANRVNVVLMLVQLSVLVAFVALAARYVAALNGAGGLASVRPFFEAGVPFSASVAGAAIAAYSFLGFDAVSTLTEETREPTRTMPKAIMIIAVIGGLLFTGSAYITQLAHPGGTFASVDSAASEIALMIGGDLFVTVFLATLVVAQFTSGLAAQASVGRLLFAMGRDGVLPAGLFGKLHETWRTPVLNLVFVGVVGLLALTLDVTTSTSFINFGAFLAFTAVNVSVIALYLKGNAIVRPLGPVLGLAVPAAGALCDLFLLWNLDSHAKLLGVLWLAIGIAYLAYLTRFFQLAPPEVEFVE